MRMDISHQTLYCDVGATVAFNCSCCDTALGCVPLFIAGFHVRILLIKCYFTLHQEDMEDEAALIKSAFPNFADEILFLRTAFPAETTLCPSNDGINLNILVTPGVCEIPSRCILSLRGIFSLTCYSQYPLLPPVVKVVGTVGLSDSALSKLQLNIAAVIDSCQKDHVIFPLIEVFYMNLLLMCSSISTVDIVVLVILLGLRFKYWKESSQGGGSGYGSILTSSDLTISKLEESPAVNVPFPFFSLCNANPARGSILFGLHAENEKSPLWYEKFLDALLARPLSLKVDDVDGVHNANFHLMLNHTAHEMKNMLVEQVASILFICANILNCMTSEKLHLELDPESVDYLIPNSGLVGFRFLIHETPEPHWVHHQSAVFLGAQFHTMLRLVGTRKVHESDCVPQRTWEACLRKCLLFRIQKECGCIFSGNVFQSAPQFQKEFRKCAGNLNFS
ncbi:hypothetical protein EGR_01601 [Echinococcus granulosus]|uniref:Uncharacterized protein n=1 Tax=Echinococcus granulosus TaxID=6210 RepID=W6V9Y9_ECHGR|nr:hypothetical protein EGR_01601 [Echinococcus granulosus]EUB63519.1 hypothetical protein EGR_01601 [Echinococcus granulosus]